MIRVAVGGRLNEKQLLRLSRLRHARDAAEARVEKLNVAIQELAICRHGVCVADSHCLNCERETASRG